jgi:hypothetical protein
VWTGVFGAAGLLCGSEFHEFDAGVVWVVEIELPFAVAADFRLLGAGPAVCAELFFSSVNVWNAEGDVVHDAERVMVRVSGDVEHVFEPVGAVFARDLHIHPIGPIVFRAAMPIHMEAQQFLIEMIHLNAILDDIAHMNYCAAHLVFPFVAQWQRLGKLDESDGMPFGINYLKKLRVIGKGDHIPCGNARAGEEVTQSYRVVGAKCDESQAIRAGLSPKRLNLDLLDGVDLEAKRSVAARPARGQSETFAIKLAGFFEIRSEKPNSSNVADATLRRLVLRKEQQGEQD